MGPKNDMVNFGYEVVDVFDKMFGDFDSFWDGFACNVKPIYSCASFPPIDIYVKENKDLVFEFAVAGYSEDAVNLNFHSDYMIMKIEKTGKEAGKEKVHYLRQGIKHSKIEERYYVPSSKYNKDETKAELKDGLLVVTIPAKEEAKPKSIKIVKG